MVTWWLFYTTDCFGWAQASSVWGLAGWSSRWRGSCFQEDSFEGWGCSREKCSDELLGMNMIVAEPPFGHCNWLTWY